MIQYDRGKFDAELERDESCKLRFYWDTATPRCRTIGIGRNLDARRLCSDGSYALGITPGETRSLGITRDSCIAKGITRQVAIALCNNDVAGCEKDLDRALPWWRTLNDARQRVLLNMCFNLGIAKLLGFKQTLHDVCSGAYNAAAADMMDSAWAKQVGDRATRLRDMMISG